jgi:hypothetical protein
MPSNIHPGVMKSRWLLALGRFWPVSAWGPARTASSCHDHHQQLAVHERHGLMCTASTLAFSMFGAETTTMDFAEHACYQFAAITVCVQYA